MHLCRTHTEDHHHQSRGEVRGRSRSEHGYRGAARSVAAAEIGEDLAQLAQCTLAQCTLLAQCAVHNFIAFFTSSKYQNQNNNQHSPINPSVPAAASPHVVLVAAAVPKSSHYGIFGLLKHKLGLGPASGKQKVSCDWWRAVTMLTSDWSRTQPPAGRRSQRGSRQSWTGGWR